MSRVYGKQAVDRQTRAVVSKVDDEEPIIKEDGRVRSLQRLPTIQFLSGAYADLRGHKFGSMVVIGVFIKQNPKKNTKWVVQCNCGYYEVRNSNSIKRESNYNDACLRCSQTNPLKGNKNTYGRELHKYTKSQMDQYADNQSVEFAKWLLKQDVVTRTIENLLIEFKHK